MPLYVKDALQRLDDAGYVAYVVGGSVRDFFLGRESKDHDIATSASPDELCRLFPEAVTVGKAFGVLKIPLKDESSEFLEIATFREDLEYKDFRHPQKVRFSGPVEDARRRDFTINALFYDPKTLRVLDTTGGMEDLKHCVIRAIGQPSARFKEDALRLLRAVRFAAALDFTIHPATAEAIQARAKLIKHVSAERIRDELTLMWTGSNPALALELLHKLGLLKQVLPEITSLRGVTQSALYHPEGDVWEHTVKALRCLREQIPARSATLAWGTLLHDVGKPLAATRSGGKNFNGHEVDGSKIAREIGARLKMSREDTDRIVVLIAEHMKFKDVFQMRESTLQRFIRQPHFEELLALYKADVLASDGNLSYYEFCSSRFEELNKSTNIEVARLVDGKDLIQLGLKPGPEFTDILRTIEDLAFEKKLSSKEDALEYVIKHFVK